MKKTDNFDSLMLQLEEAATKLADENTSLDEAISIYATASKLIAACSEKLNSAKIEIAEIDKQIEGNEND